MAMVAEIVPLYERAELCTRCWREQEGEGDDDDSWRLWPRDEDEEEEDYDDEAPAEDGDEL